MSNRIERILCWMVIMCLIGGLLCLGHHHNTALAFFLGAGGGACAGFIMSLTYHLSNKKV